MVGAEVLAAVVLVYTAGISAWPVTLGMSPLAPSAASIVGRPVLASVTLREETLHGGGSPARFIGVTVRFAGSLERRVDDLEGAVRIFSNLVDFLELIISLYPSVGQGL